MADWSDLEQRQIKQAENFVRCCFDRMC